MRFHYLAALFFAYSTAALSSGVFQEDGSMIQPGSEASVSAGSLEGRADESPYNTNAKRLQAGLPLLPPAGRRSRRDVSPRASCTSLTNTLGNIEVRDTSGNFKGYIRNTFDGQNSYTFGTINDAAVFLLPNGRAYDEPIDIVHVNGPDTTHSLIGAVAGSAGYNFASGQIGYAYLAGTGHTPAYSPPSTTAGTSIDSLGYSGPSESQIWTITCGGALTAQWTNADNKAQPPTSIFYDGAVDFVGLVGDFDKFTSTFPGEGAYLVTLRFIPL